MFYVYDCAKKGRERERELGIASVGDGPQRKTPQNNSFIYKEQRG